METIISSVITGILGVVVCMINNNTQRVKEQAAIEAKMDSINANYDKQTALIIQQIGTLSDRVEVHNGLIDRMYIVEEKTKMHDYILQELREDDRR